MGKSAKSGPLRAVTKRIPLRAVTTKTKPAMSVYMVKTAKSGADIKGRVTAEATVETAIVLIAQCPR